MRRNNIFIAIFLISLCISVKAQNYPNTFHKIWQDRSWNEGALTPAGAIWSLSGNHDFDQDGKGEFLYSSSWSGIYGNDAALYEYAGGDSFSITWYYWFSQLDSDDENYSVNCTGDLDNDGNQEIIVLTDCLAGQNTLYIFEYNPLTGNFPFTPDAVWDLGISGGVLESCVLKVENMDSDVNPEIIAYVYARDPLKPHLIIAELQPGSTVAQPQWHKELDDSTTFAFYAYLAQPFDLDGDSKKEIVVVEWNYTRMVIYENTNEDQYQKVNDLYLTFEPLGFSNEGATARDMNSDGKSELYLTSSQGYLWLVTNNGDVSQIAFANNFNLLHNFKSDGGYRLTHLLNGNADSPVSGVNDGADIYLSATDSLGTTSVIFDLEYGGGAPSDPNSYTLYEVYRESGTPEDIFMTSKFALGDHDGDGSQEIVLSSYSLSLNRPHVIVLESDVTNDIVSNDIFLPQTISLMGNYPNPFNARTKIKFYLRRNDKVTVTIHDITGRSISQLLFEHNLSAGEQFVIWNTENQASGIYFYQITTNQNAASGKMLLLR